ncbi:unnamed protein product [Withania somnifera]
MSEDLFSIHPQQQQVLEPNPNPKAHPSSKKRRNLPGTPDPDAEVIALSPKTLMATNRFICEICNKGFQRDQNLQLHRRGHNLPWKLKQRNKQEIVKKKVYICPEKACVHHDPSRALGDLTGIKKHFSRKHGEKKWKCEKCSKKYAVQSDWKAHTKTCGTREYKCDCGTLFSSSTGLIPDHHMVQTPSPNMFGSSSINNQMLATTTTTTTTPAHSIYSDNHQTHHTKSSTPMSATALLQKAAQMGSTKSTPNYFSNTFGVMHSSSSPSSNNTQIFNDNNAEIHQTFAKQREDYSTNNVLINGCPNMNSSCHSKTISLDQALLETGGMHNQSVHFNLDNSLTRDFLGIRNEGSQPFLPQELAKLASMSSAMGLSHYTSGH